MTTNRESDQVLQVVTAALVSPTNGLRFRSSSDGGAPRTLIWCFKCFARFDFGCLERGEGDGSVEDLKYESKCSSLFIYEDDFKEEHNFVARLIQMLYNDDPEEMLKQRFGLRASTDHDGGILVIFLRSGSGTGSSF
ncbi:hypothetical protein L1987_71530 [Smallanthus sonchifolius]|uniref:Uncharacterized protein n=1 Tax=Smallanthus sonchifolius TaxID=185202 RepID=A0ACB9AX04_9ASTR|nr:hypothetical protein L1987_71530 [Smallanthus sonchifolius]